MPQMHFPFFPEGVTCINSLVAFEKRDGVVTYFNGQMPLFTHQENDLQCFRLYVCQLFLMGVAKQAEIAQAFGLPMVSVKRWVKRYRERGVNGFFVEPRRRGAAVLTPPVLAKAQALLDQGLEVPSAAEQLKLKPNTLMKAVRDGRLHKQTVTPEAKVSDASSKSQRSVEDGTASMGMGATNTMDRVAASLGTLESAEVKFQPALDVPNGGVLLALPALLAMGLLRYTEKHFTLPKGYYDIKSIFLLLAFMALARLKSVEALRFSSPGEWGKLLGLDRAPEVRTLRTKVAHMSEGDAPAQWGLELCQDWMKSFPAQATAFYVDGHVRVYHGEQTKLPRHYVARQKLCLRAVTDYWVNAMDGQPFFVVYQDVDPGLIQVLRDQIVPRLERDTPNQPTEEQLQADQYLHRFTLVFDRAGYSPGLFRELKERRIACLSYRKTPGDKWAEHEFFPVKVELVSGNVVEMRLAERGTLLGSKKKEQIWVREIRRLMPCGHQTSVITTDYRSEMSRLAGAMFARWCQENFFKYMRQNFGMDQLACYQTEDLPDTTVVVNPKYRRLDGQVRSRTAVLTRKSAEFGAMTTTSEDLSPDKMEAHLQKKAELHEEILLLRDEVDELKKRRKEEKKHLELRELPEEERFQRLSGRAKQFVDTIKMLAYRAETAMAHTLRERMSRLDDARSLLRAVYCAEVDLLPNYEDNVLNVRLHHLANRSSDIAVQHLCQELTETETVFPGTTLRLVYQLVSEPSGLESRESADAILVSSQNP